MTSAGECDSPWVLKLNRTGSRGILGRKDLIGDLTWGDAIWSTEKLWRCAYICVYIYIYLSLYLYTIMDNFYSRSSVYLYTACIYIYMCVCVWENYGEHRGESKCIGIGYIVIPQYFHHSGKAASWSSLRPFPFRFPDIPSAHVFCFLQNPNIFHSHNATMLTPCTYKHIYTRSCLFTLNGYHFDRFWRHVGSFWF